MNRIGFIGENSIEYIDKLLDIWNNDDCAVLIDWRIPFRTAVEMMKEASVQKCYIEKKVLDKTHYKERMGILFVSFEKKKNVAELLPSELYRKFKEKYSSNEAIILYSSGTTGKAKGIILSHYAINTNADAIINYMKPIENDCIYIAKTISHSSTITGELLVALKSKMKLVIAPTIVPPRFVLKNIEHFGVTIICLNPTLLSLYTDEYVREVYKFSFLRTIYVSGSILNDKTYKISHATFDKIPIYNVYGLSEVGPRVAAQTEACCKSNSVGKAIRGVEIKIIGDDGSEVCHGEKGIVYINTPSRFEGYITGNKKLPSLYKNWFNSGDIGYLDVNGELHISGRIDDIINTGSHKVFPYNIEKIIANMESIKQCAVIGIPNDKMGAEIICFYSATNDIPIESKLLHQQCVERLPSYEIPTKWIFIKEFPTYSNGKIQRNELVNHFFAKGELS